MKSELELLIELLEAEKQSLELLIDQNLKEYEYLSVYHHGEALIKLDHRLLVLRCFKDPLFEREDRLERMTDYMTRGDNEFLKSYWEEWIAAEKEEIRKARKQTKSYFNDTQEIDNAIFNLYEGVFSKFRLYISHRGEQFYFEFKIERNQILSVAVETSMLFNNDDPDDRESNQIHLFKNLGFKLNNGSGMMVYNHDVRDFKDAIVIKTLLAKVIYDIGYGGDKKQGKLEFFY